MTCAAMTYADLPILPAVVPGTVTHRRREPVAHGFSHRTYQWLVDLDDPPVGGATTRWLAGFRAADHLGGSADDDRRHPSDDGTRRIKANVVSYLAARSVDLGPDGRIVMLANARVLGYVFDPLTMYWCFDSDSRLRCQVAEVHNTYGERTAYLLEPDPAGRSEVDKSFYVSPFNDVSGTYAIAATATRRRVAVSITLHREAVPPFVATFSGTPRPATRRGVLRAAMRTPLAPQRARGLITVHGVWLWARGLRVVPRPVHRSPRGV